VRTLPSPLLPLVQEKSRHQFPLFLFSGEQLLSSVLTLSFLWQEVGVSAKPSPLSSAVRHLGFSHCIFFTTRREEKSHQGLAKRRVLFFLSPFSPPGLSGPAAFPLVLFISAWPNPKWASREFDSFPPPQQKPFPLQQTAFFLQRARGPPSLFFVFFSPHFVFYTSQSTLRISFSFPFVFPPRRTSSSFFLFLSTGPVASKG